MPGTNPKLRNDLTIGPVQQNGQTVLVVQDTLGIIENPLCLTEIAGLLLSLADGTRSVGEIQSVFRQLTGGRIPEDFVSKHIEEMERLMLLESQTYHARKRELVESFLGTDLREPSHAMVGYQEDPEALGEWIEGILEEYGGPKVQDEKVPRVLVAPHIDFRVNTSLYASTYRRIRNRAYDRVVLMGTGHSISEGVYSPTKKDFQTPFGITKTDRGAIERLEACSNGITSPDDFPHRKEHALEFQLIFLQHLLGHDGFEIVPVLCGSVHPLLTKVARLREAPEVRPFLEALREIVAADDRRTLVVAGIDFSHIGLRFSHPAPATEILEEARRHDRDLIESFTRGDAESFWRFEAQSGGRFNVCGFSTLATILEVVEPLEGRCLAYEVWDDAPTGSAVTFASIVV